MLEQHFLNEKGKKEISSILEKINFNKYEILELGSGTGMLTEEILKRNPKKITCYEIDDLKNICEGKIELKKENIININFKEYDGDIIISAPPYSILEELKNELNNFPLLLIISKKYFKLFNGLNELKEIDEDCFVPKSSKKHCIVCNELFLEKFKNKDEIDFF